MVSELGVLASQVEVIPNWTHIQARIIKTDAYRDRFNWSGQSVVLHAGNMGAKQGLENVIAAAKLANSREPTLRFVLLGDGNRRSELERLARGVGNLEFISPLDDEAFQGAMAAADILLVNELPGVTEMSVPSKLTSYFAAGKPVLAATDKGSITDQEITKARAGIRVDAGDAEALVQAAASLAANPVLRRQLGPSGQHYQRETLSKDRALAHYAEFIDKLAAGQTLSSRRTINGEN
jgi:glycosyltransferase involved in cell wall biosynthesis